MKKIWLLTAVCTSLTIVSCKSDPDETPPPQKPEPVEKKLMAYKTTQYFQDGSEMPGKEELVIENTFNHTITIWADTVKDSYTRYFADEKGLLQKVLFHKLDINFQTKDSIVIERPSNGVFNILRTGSSPFKCVVSSLPDGGKMVTYSRPSASTPYFRKTTFDKDGLPIKSINASSSTGRDIRVTIFYYDANKRLIERTDTTTIEPTNYTDIRKYTISKDNSPNTFLTSLMKKMIGPDLEWLLSDSEYSSIPFPIGFYFPPYVSLVNGTITAEGYTGKLSTDGTNFTPNGADNMNFRTIYDSKGRISKREALFPYFNRTTDFRYFD
jgi:YD repeat-containing protein